MAQSNTTVTPDGPTPPTNIVGGCVGMRPPTTAGLSQLDDGATAAVPGGGGNAGGSLTAFGAPVSGTASEGAGTEVVVTASVPNPSPNGQLVMDSDLGSYTVKPNGDHASSLSPSTNPAIVSLSPASVASGGGTFALTVTGTNFTRQSVVNINGIPQTTVFVSATSLTVATALKKATAGTLPVTVVTGGVTTAATNMTYT